MLPKVIACAFFLLATQAATTNTGTEAKEDGTMTRRLMRREKPHKKATQQGSNKPSVTKSDAELKAVYPVGELQQTAAPTEAPTEATTAAPTCTAKGPGCFCLKIATGSDAGNDGHLSVMVKPAGGQYPNVADPILSGYAALNSIKVSCGNAAIYEVKLWGSSTDGWMGSIEYSAEDDTWAAMQCRPTNSGCTGITNTTQQTYVDSDDTETSAVISDTTVCDNENPCYLVPTGPLVPYPR